MIIQISPEVTQISFNNFGSIVYLIQLPNNNILIDTSSRENSEELLKQIKIPKEEIDTIILTHAHWDHVENINIFPNAKIYGNFTRLIGRDHSQKENKKIISIDKFPIKNFEIYKTPGHTPGDIVLIYKNILFSGDVIFNDGYIGRTDLPESIPKKMEETLKFVKSLKYKILCPGH